ncbi:MAG: hypothetical protein M3507_10500 [Actinomycetota bacterium]|jgi:hypothetical protein|nr:hypothetical protein [Actinomycetota bacterium]
MPVTHRPRLRRLTLRRLAVTGLAGVLAATGLTACRPGTVRLTFRPEVGATYRYEVEVRTRSEVDLGRGDPEIREEDVVLSSEHTVLQSDDDGVLVRVLLQEPGAEDRIFEVVFDRAAQLEAVQSIEGVPDESLGTLGISEIFPAAAGAPPDRPLGPGASWTIDDAIQLPGVGAATELTGSGRLVELAVVGDEEVARLASSARLPLESQVLGPNGALRLSGTQVTDYRATHDLDDGAVREATSDTVGRFDLEVGPPPGQAGSPVRGSLVVEVSSRTRLLDTPT